MRDLRWNVNTDQNEWNELTGGVEWSTCTHSLTHTHTHPHTHTHTHTHTHFQATQVHLKPMTEPISQDHIFLYGTSIQFLDLSVFNGQNEPTIKKASCCQILRVWQVIHNICWEYGSICWNIKLAKALTSISDSWPCQDQRLSISPSWCLLGHFQAGKFSSLLDWRREPHWHHQHWPPPEQWMLAEAWQNRFHSPQLPQVCTWKLLQSPEARGMTATNRKHSVRMEW